MFSTHKACHKNDPKDSVPWDPSAPRSRTVEASEMATAASGAPDEIRETRHQGLQVASELPKIAGVENPKKKIPWKKIGFSMNKQNPFWGSFYFWKHLNEGSKYQWLFLVPLILGTYISPFHLFWGTRNNHWTYAPQKNLCHSEINLVVLQGKIFAAPWCSTSTLMVKFPGVTEVEPYGFVKRTSNYRK